MIIDTAQPAIVEWKKKTALVQDRRGKQETFGAEEIRREAITVMCPLSSLRTPLPLDFRKLQLDSSKAIKLSTDKNKRMFFHSLLFLCLFIPLSPFCSSLCPLPYPPLGLRALPNLALSPLVLSLSLSLSGHFPRPPLFLVPVHLHVGLCITFYRITVFVTFIREALPFLFSMQYRVIILSATRSHVGVCMYMCLCL